MKSDIICLQEISVKRNTKPFIPGYHYYSTGCGRNRGVAIFIKDFLYTSVENVIVKDMDYAQFMMLCFKTFNLISVYRTHLCKIPLYEEMFLKMLFSLIDPNKQTIINGDFNIDLLDEKEKLITTRMQQLGFTQIIKEPTTVRGNCIDHFYMPSNESNYDCKLYYPYYGDHEAIIVIVKGWGRIPTRSQIKRQLKKRKNKSNAP